MGEPTEEPLDLEGEIRAWAEEIEGDGGRVRQERIFHQILPSILKQAQKTLMNRGPVDPEDVAQDLYVHLPRILGTYLKSVECKGVGNFHSYVRQCVIHISVDYLEGRRREDEAWHAKNGDLPPHLPTTPSVFVMRVEHREMFDRESERLDPTDQAILEGHRQGRSDAEIARELGMPERTVNSRRHGICKVLMQRFRKFYGGDPCAN